MDKQYYIAITADGDDDIKRLIGPFPTNYQSLRWIAGYAKHNLQDLVQIKLHYHQNTYLWMDEDNYGEIRLQIVQNQSVYY
jgi:hypothetical protein